MKSITLSLLLLVTGAITVTPSLVHAKEVINHRVILMEGDVNNKVPIEIALGDGSKVPSNGENKNKLIARKSIVARREIHSGDSFTEDNLTTKRPGTGISPMKWYEILGQTASRDYQSDEIIEQ